MIVLRVFRTGRWFGELCCIVHKQGKDHHSWKDLVKHSRKFDIFRGRRRSDSLLREAGQHVSPFWWIPVAVA